MMMIIIIPAAGQMTFVDYAVTKMTNRKRREIGFCSIRPKHWLSAVQLSKILQAATTQAKEASEKWAELDTNGSERV